MAEVGMLFVLICDLCDDKVEKANSKSLLWVIIEGRKFILTRQERILVKKARLEPCLAWYHCATTALLLLLPS